MIIKYPPDIVLTRALELRDDARRALFCVHPELHHYEIDIMGTGRSGTVVRLNSQPPRLFKIFKAKNGSAFESEVKHALLMQKLIPDKAIGFLAATRIGAKGCRGARGCRCAKGCRGVAEMPPSSSSSSSSAAIDMFYAAHYKSLRYHHMVSALDAMLAMHSVGYLHNDIKPENFLVVCERAKLIDFGTCRPIGDAISGGTWEFMHPRVSRSKLTERTVSTDAYSFAVTTLISLDTTITNSKRDTLAAAAAAYITDTPIHRALAVAHAMVEWAHCNPLLEYDGFTTVDIFDLRAALYACVEWV